MKRITALLLAMLLACTAVVGCEKDEPYETPNETTQSETSAQTEDVIKDYDQEDFQQGFSIKGKKYYYKGNSFNDQYTGYSEGNVLILTVTNETETDYKVRVKITYLDENGEKLKTQSQAFDQYIAGYTNYFIFQPGEEYASYSCELNLKEIGVEEKSDIIVDKIKLSFEGLREKMTVDYEKVFSEGVMAEVPGILGRTKVTFTEEFPPKDLRGYFVLFDNTGDIYIIASYGTSNCTLDKRLVSERVSDHHIYFERENNSKVVWPEELKGELTVLNFLVDIKDIQS